MDTNLAVPIPMKLVCLNAGEAIMTGTYGVHGLVISITGGRMDAITSLECLGAVHLCGTVIATMF